jgi:hypothetical protein
VHDRRPPARARDVRQRGPTLQITIASSVRVVTAW